MAKCDKSNCLNCEREKCIYDENLEEKKAQKSEYDKEYYKKNNVARKAYFHERYLSKTYGTDMQPKEKWVKYIEVRRTVTKLKKQIGEANSKIILEALKELETELN